MAAPKLDKDHGFIKFIVSNQLDREKYEQEQKSLKQTGLSQENKKKYREERKTYIPPFRANNTRGRGSKLTSRCTQASMRSGNYSHRGNISEKGDRGLQGDQALKDSKLLFEIEYLPKHSNPVYAKVYQNSSPKAIVKEISEKSDLTDMLKDALYWRILEEMQGEHA